MTYRLDPDADPAELSALIRKGIREADPTDVGSRDWQPVSLALRDTAGEIIGGIYGATMWKWLMIDGLWVKEELRGSGLGRQLLSTAEEFAVERGCIGSWLGTFDFQARGFYEAQGYEMFAGLPGFPPGRIHYHLLKRFADDAQS